MNYQEQIKTLVAEARWYRAQFLYWRMHGKKDKANRCQEVALGYLAAADILSIVVTGEPLGVKDA